VTAVLENVPGEGHGWGIRVTAPTAPQRSRSPSMIEASSSIPPAALSTAPRPALKRGCAPLNRPSGAVALSEKVQDAAPQAPEGVNVIGHEHLLLELTEDDLDLIHEPLSPKTPSPRFAGVDQRARSDRGVAPVGMLVSQEEDFRPDHFGLWGRPEPCNPSELFVLRSCETDPLPAIRPRRHGSLLTVK
jgi:hypothetical protein